MSRTERLSLGVVSAFSMSSGAGMSGAPATIIAALLNMAGTVPPPWCAGGAMVACFRWIGAGLRESTRSFRRLRGHRDLAALIRALDRTAMDSRKVVA
jgi:hypothetical protein